jgi:hypothetical protein
MVIYSGVEVWHGIDKVFNFATEIGTGSLVLSNVH